MSTQGTSNTLRLLRGKVLLGTIVVNPVDATSPWRSGTFKPSGDFEEVRELFDHELKLLRANTSDDPEKWEEWEAVHDELHDPGMRLEAQDKSLVADEFLIHIDGTEAFWRVE